MSLHFPHAIRDPIHGFIRLTADEMRGIDTRELQRLRGIAQLGLSERVYPGARHSRFEHALGALEVITRMFEELRGRFGIDGILGPLGLPVRVREYERLLQVGRWVALLHDVGHAPFSHVTEDLLPLRRNHEDVTRLLLDIGELGAVLQSLEPEVAGGIRRALAPGSASDATDVRLVRALVSGPVGADRMDYLLRDSAATGVSYGIFDLHRVLHTLALISEDDGAVTLGIDKGGVMAVEGMLWARTSMFQQVYLHRTRRILDLHLADFLRAALPGGGYPADLNAYLEWTDARLLEMLRVAAADPRAPGHRDARRIVRREQHRALPHELASDRRDLLRGWLEQWRQRVLAAAPQAEPIADLVDPPEADGAADLKVLDSDRRASPLAQLSRLAHHMRQRPLGRLYVAHECDDLSRREFFENHLTEC